MRYDWEANKVEYWEDKYHSLRSSLDSAIEEIEEWQDEIDNKRKTSEDDGKHTYLDGQMAGLSGALYYLCKHIGK